MPEIKSAPAPRFVSFKDTGALVVPTFWAGNVSDPDEKFTLGLSTLSETDAPVWGLKLLSPEYVGVMKCVPAVANDVVNVACPLTTGADPKLFGPSLKVTLPVGKNDF